MARAYDNDAHRIVYPMGIMRYGLKPAFKICSLKSALNKLLKQVFKSVIQHASREHR